MSGAAAQQIEALARQHRGRLTIALHAFARRELRPGLQKVATTSRYTAMCEVLATPRVLLVYGVMENEELFAALLGPQLSRVVLRREWNRRAHGRY